MPEQQIYCKELALADGEAYDKITDLLFDEADSVILYAHKNDFSKQIRPYADFSPIARDAYDEKETVTKDGGVLALYFHTSLPVREYFKKLQSFCAYLYDETLSRAPYMYFTDTSFIKDGEPILSFRLSDNFISCDESLSKKVKEIYYDCLARDEVYLAVKEKFSSLPERRKQYYLNTGIRLIRNLLVYRELEDTKLKKSPDKKRLKLIETLFQKSEIISPFAYKNLLREVFPKRFLRELDYTESFKQIAVIAPKIEELLYKLTYYLENETGNSPAERNYVS